ncbi:tetratricopeptide repeat protein [Roseobacter weihaiensis]|uniref:tetratricopeptide repeat protein n=1 Tax=Roseobacter weihaiensis TaxID=2763262 RepID=UPI001D0A252B|nr:tetratricopeptide repeat protein [Roseobacter sp. H9]
MKLKAFAFVVLASPGLADCPPVPDISGPLTSLIEQARAAPNDAAGRALSDEMWKLWLRPPDEAAQAVLDRGLRARASYDFLGAIEAYTDLIEYCPFYAEGFNQRAFIHFLRDDYGKALVDLDKTLALLPDHVGAQSGRALTLMNLGRLSEARVQLLEALENNPWLSERFLLNEGGPLASEGKDI